VTVTGSIEEGTAMYELTNVTKTYRKNHSTVQALADVSLTIGDGDFLAIQGPTGQGKTTLLQLLGGLDRPTSGSVVFDGRDLSSMREGALTDLRSHSFGFVFQGFNLIPTLTAQENVETALVPLSVKARARKARSLRALADVGLAERANHLPSELSGGEQQRVAIARALVRDPRVILADEPSGNLDERMRDEIIGLLERLWAERGQTLIIVTHDSWIAARAPTRAWIQEGRLSQQDRLGAEAQPGAGASSLRR
jgi:putative ABC transport system ATP-binding protein